MTKIIFIFIEILLLSSLTSGNIWDLFARKIHLRKSRKLNYIANEEPIKSTALRLIETHGYLAESHEVQTDDGYLLTLHRIPTGRNSILNSTDGIKRPVVLLHHGLMASSDSWILRGPDKDLAFILADNGYDVWLANCRGNYYSRKHITLNPNTDKKFWKFSFHEIGFYDVPATIDYILKTTNERSIFYIGHSMGAGVFFIMTSMKPEYNSKVKFMQGLAPATFIVHRPSPVMKFFISNGPSLMVTLQSQGYYELFPLRKLNGQISRIFCRGDSPTQPFCMAAVFLVVGIDDQQKNNTLLPELLDYFPAGASLYQLLHFLQSIMSGEFRQIDYGETINLKKYQSAKPPHYDLTKVTAPSALFYGDGDFLITREDTEMLSSHLSNCLGAFRVPFRFFNHLDFLWSHDSKTLLYDQMLTIMKKYR